MYLTYPSQRKATLNLPHFPQTNAERGNKKHSGIMHVIPATKVQTTGFETSIYSIYFMVKSILVSDFNIWLQKQKRMGSFVNSTSGK